MSVKEPSHRGQKRKDRDSPGHHPPSTPRPDRFPVIQKGVTFSVVEVDGRLRALKHFPPSGDFYFHSGLPSLTEVDLTSRLRHPALLAREVLLGPSSVSDLSGLSLVYPLPAFDLYDALSSPLFPFSARFRLLEELFSALGYLHSQGVLHLNVSLPAVTLSGSAEAPRCTLGALESALYVDDPARGRRLPGPLLGAPDHLAPELLEQSLRLLRSEKKKPRRAGVSASPEAARGMSMRTALSALSGEPPSAKPDSPFKLSPRASEEEAELGILYTGAADVWALGVLSLYVLSAQGIYPCFAKGTAPAGWQSSVLSYVREYFSPGRREETLAHFLQAVPRKIRPRVNTALLSAMLDPEPGKRPRAQLLGPLLLPAPEKSIPVTDSSESGDSSKADNFLGVQDDSVKPLGPDFHNLNKLMILFLIHAYSGERMEVLFLAVDLLYRAALLFRPDISDEEQLVTAACCMFMAAKLVRETSKLFQDAGEEEEAGPSRADVWAPSVHRAALVAAEQSGGEVTAHKILERELSLVEELGGVLYPPRWYHACRTRYQLSCVYEKVIRRPVEEYQRGFRPLAVLREEVEAEFGEAPEEMAELPQDKDITIEEYFS